MNGTSFAQQSDRFPARSRNRTSASMGRRLASERRRLGLKQYEFAAIIGASKGNQSLYERGHRELRAADLQSSHGAGIDVPYVLAGRRSRKPLVADAPQFFAAIARLPTDVRSEFHCVVQALAEACNSRRGRTRTRGQVIDGSADMRSHPPGLLVGGRAGAGAP